MSMSRKDYRAFAAMLLSRRQYADSRAEHLLLDTITGEMVSIFARDNSNFSRSIFEEAAGSNSPQAEAARVEPTERILDPALARRAY